MEILAVAALGFFAAGYFVLGGADVGVGLLLPFLAGSAYERHLLVAAIVPSFLGSEMWLVATAGVLAGAFPSLAGELLGGLLPAVVALLAGWVVRDVGLWLCWTRGRVDAPAWRVLRDATVTGGSWAIALSWGWMFAGLLAGVTGRLVTGAGAALATVAVAALFTAHGLAFAALRLPGALRERARGLSGGSGETRTFALTSVAMAALCLAAGFRLPLTVSAADAATLAVLVPAVLVVAPLLVAAQARAWRNSGPASGRAARER